MQTVAKAATRSFLFGPQAPSTIRNVARNLSHSSGPNTELSLNGGNCTGSAIDVVIFVNLIHFLRPKLSRVDMGAKILESCQFLNV